MIIDPTSLEQMGGLESMLKEGRLRNVFGEVCEGLIIDPRDTEPIKIIPSGNNDPETGLPIYTLIEENEDVDFDDF